MCHVILDRHNQLENTKMLSLSLTLYKNFNLKKNWTAFPVRQLIVNAIEKVQKQFTKRIYSLSHLLYPKRLAVLNLEPLELCRVKNVLVMEYKCLNNLVALPSDEYFCQQHQFFQTRSGGNRLNTPLCSTNHFKMTFLIVV